jgi:hypothetical protein
MYNLSDRTFSNITKTTGISKEEFHKLNCTEIDRKIEEKIKNKLKYPTKKDSRKAGRGSVFISLFRFIFIKDTDRKLSKI